MSLIQAGNAVLTQLDRLRRYPNVLVLCTSNLTEMIDSAFVDRVDIKQFVGPPNVEARYEILRSQIEAMLRPVGVAAASMLLNDCGVALPLLSYQRLRGVAASEAAVQSLRNESPQGAATLLVCQQMEQIAQQCEVSTQRIRTSVSIGWIEAPQQLFPLCCSFDLRFCSCAVSQSVGGRLLRRAPLRCCSDFRQANRGRAARISLSHFLTQLPIAIQRERAAADRLQTISGGDANGSSTVVNGHSSAPFAPSGTADIHMQ